MPFFLWKGRVEEGEVYLYRYSETEDGTPVLDNIVDDDEYEIVADAFDEMLDDDQNTTSW